MLRKPKTITSNNRAPKTLKPQQARQLIRRFHVLQKNRKSLEQLLSEVKPGFDLETYLQSPEPAYTKQLKEYKYAKTPEIHHIDRKLLYAELIRTLAKVDAELQQRGGLHVYQMASTVGQKSERGGDSLKWLVTLYKRLGRTATRTLEIGSLSPTNAILTSGIFGEVTRIDLNSQHPQILQQDFMKRPLPLGKDEKFDLILCSLVLNFVPTPSGRGNMLRRMTEFLEPFQKGQKPSLFFVLPLPCVTNSRYFNKSLFANVMKSLGFEEIEYHEAKKVAYWLFDWHGRGKKIQYPSKSEVNPGKQRNNFYIDMN